MRRCPHRELRSLEPGLHLERRGRRGARGPELPRPESFGSAALRRPAAGSWSAGFAFRFALLGAGVGLAIWAGSHPVGLLLGLSLIVPAAVAAAWRARPPVLSGLPALPPEDPSWDRWDPWLAREREEEEEAP